MMQMDVGLIIMMVVWEWRNGGMEGWMGEKRRGERDRRCGDAKGEC
jgi:hypothetical protein